MKKSLTACGIYVQVIRYYALLKKLRLAFLNPSTTVLFLKYLKYRKTIENAKYRFYHNGEILGPLQTLNELDEKVLRSNLKTRQFYDFLAGFSSDEINNILTLPPKQPNPGFFTRPKHVLYCLHQSLPYVTNGYATRSHGIASGLKHFGCKITATTRSGFPWDANEAFENKRYLFENIDGIKYTAFKGRNVNSTRLKYYIAEAADHFFREAQATGAEVIIAASNHITALAALLAARRAGLPFVYEVRGLWEVTQGSIRSEWLGSERYQLIRSLEQQAAIEADLIVTITEELAHEIVSWGIPFERICIVPNAVNAELFQPKEKDPELVKKLDLKPDVPVIGYAGSTVAYEGLELLMQSLKQLAHEGEDFVFVLVGDGKDIDKLKQQAETLKIMDQCRFTGRVAFDEVPRYISCMDIMPVPRKSLPVTEMVSALKPLESMAMGKAVVLSDVSPHKIMAGNNERALLFEKDSVDGLSEALKVLLHDPQKRQSLGRAARDWVEKERTWNQVTSAYSNRLETLIRKSKKSTQVCSNTEFKELQHIKIGLIADTFTTETLAGAVDILSLSPTNWLEVLEKESIDVLLIESAWSGKNGDWQGKIGYYCEDTFDILEQLITFCREQNIPSLFWNKEDPVHFKRFYKAASLCDHVFTTDSDRIIPYLAVPETHAKTVSSIPFFASPNIHNLLPSKRDWQPTAAYGGTYYGARYAERTDYMDMIMSAAAPLGLTIYDRQHDAESPYKYPNGLSDYVVGGLSYMEMIQAYKAHPVQINVNSVLDSPTMFSRRVLESAACGTPIVSGPGLGMNRYLNGAVHVVNSESEAAQALENLLNHHAYRWRKGLRGARAVMRAHTVHYRLIQMLRTAGMQIKASEQPSINVLCEEISATAANSVLTQTLIPIEIVARFWDTDIRHRLETAGIKCTYLDNQIAKANVPWVIASNSAIEVLDREDFEDLFWPCLYAKQRRIGFNHADNVSDDAPWPGIAYINYGIELNLQLVNPPQDIELEKLGRWAFDEPTLVIRKPAKSHEVAPDTKPVKTMVIAGHDLKFIKPFYPYFSQAGIRLLLDFWTGHNRHNEPISKRLIEQVDTIFCEWMLGNAAWYGEHKLESQNLIGRFHAQELRSQLLKKLPFEKFDKVIFVGPHVLRKVQQSNLGLKKNGVVIHNGVDIEAMSAKPKSLNNKVLGLVGMVPQSKRLDLALDILKLLRKDDTAYTLRIKGKRPEDYPWMAERTDEMVWYRKQYERLEHDPELKNAVVFDPHGNDMPQWYANIDFILSVSDHESFHLSVAEGAASGCTPIIVEWDGASEIYPKEWIYQDLNDALAGIKSGRKNPAEPQLFAKNVFDQKSIASKILSYI